MHAAGPYEGCGFDIAVAIGDPCETGGMLIAQDGSVEAGLVSFKLRPMRRQLISGIGATALSVIAQPALARDFYRRAGGPEPLARDV